MLRKLAIACAAAAACFAFASPAAAGGDDFVGQWTNDDASADGVTRITVTQTRAGLRVRVFGRCHPADCDWGETGAIPFAASASGDAWRDAGVIIARYDTSFARRTLVLRTTRSSGMDYELFTDFTDRSGRADYLERGRLQQALSARPWPHPGSPGADRFGDVAEDCVSFNTANLRVVNIGGRWKIVEGSHWIADFAGNRAAADRALEVIRRYGFTSQCFVTRPDPPMTYWLRGSTMPGGPMAGEDCLTVNPANVRARHVGGAWKVVDGDNWLLDFGANRDSAERAAVVIQHYNLTRQCFVARPNPPMQYWLSR